VPYSRPGTVGEYPPFVPPAWRGPLWDPEPPKFVKARDYVRRLRIEVYHDDDTRQGDFFLATGWCCLSRRSRGGRRLKLGYQKFKTVPVQF
jgi:hypothetical protein